MQMDEAWRILRIEATTDLHAVRAAYLSGVRVAHPDVSDAVDANERTSRLRDAYDAVVSAIAAGTALDPPPEAGEARVDDRSARPADQPSDEPTSRFRAAWNAARVAPPPPSRSHEPIDAVVLTDDTIGIAAPSNEALPFLVEACHEIGDVTFLDQAAGLVQLTVSFVDEPVCYLLMSLQGRGTGITEVFCSIESIESTPPPPIGAVTRLLVDTLTELVW